MYLYYLCIFDMFFFCTCWRKQWTMVCKLFKISIHIFLSTIDVSLFMKERDISLLYLYLDLFVLNISSPYHIFFSYWLLIMSFQRSFLLTVMCGQNDIVISSALNLYYCSSIVINPSKLRYWLWMFCSCLFLNNNQSMLSLNSSAIIVCVLNG